MPDDPNTGDVTGESPPWAQGLRAEPLIPLPPDPPPPRFYARSVALEAAARIHQRSAGGQAGYVQAASSHHVLTTAQEFFEWLMEPDDG